MIIPGQSEVEGNASSPGDALKILVIDDHRGDYRLTSHALESSELDCQITWVNRGEDALSQLIANSYDLALLDYHMPGMNGLETLRRVREKELRIPIIFITGNGDEATAVHALKLGAQDYIVKDIYGNYLEELPQKVLDTYQEAQIHSRRERRQRERQEQNERLRSTIASMDDLVFLLDKDGRFSSYYQPHSQHLLSATPEFFLGESYRDILPSHVATQVAQALQDAQRTNSVQQFEYPLASASKVYWFSAKLSLRKDVSGVSNGATIVVRDITELKQTTETLRQQATQLEALRQIGLEITSQLELDQLLHTIVSHAVDLLDAHAGGFYLFAPEQNLLTISPHHSTYPNTSEQMLQKGESLSGKVWETGTPVIVNDYKNWPHKSPAFRDTPYEAVVGVPVQSADIFFGVLSVASESPRLFTNDDTHLLNMFAVQAAVAIDNARIHEQLRSYNQSLEQKVKERTAELSEANERLKELDSLKTKLIHDLTHELRTPVANLKLYLDLLNRTASEKKQKSYLDTLSLQAERLYQLIEHVMDFSAVTENKKAVFKEIDLNEIARQVFLAQEGLAHMSNLDMRFEQQPDLPPVLGNEQYLYSAVTNIVTNAIKYTPAGEITLRTYQSKDETIILEVSDTGIGIPEEELPLLFERFYRGQQIGQSNIPGLGIGLALVKEIMLEHAGDVRVTSRADTGSTFTLTFPPYRSDSTAENDYTPID